MTSIAARKPWASLANAMATASSSKLPAPVAASRLQESLAQLRQSQSAIFGTSYNPTNARTGAKYLRRALKGQAMLRYISPSPQSPIGRNAARIGKLLDDSRFEMEGRPRWNDPKYRLEDAKPKDDVKKHPSALRTYDREAFARDVTSYRLSAADRGDVPHGFIEVEPSNERYDWLVDANELIRKSEAATRKIEGRGPPKKGEFMRVRAMRAMLILGFRRGSEITDEAAVDIPISCTFDTHIHEKRAHFTRLPGSRINSLDRTWAWIDRSGQN